MDQNTMSSGNSFIDENHEGLLDNIDAITMLLRDNWRKDEFKSRVRDFIVDLENHFSHEETILKAVGYAKLDSHAIKHREISMRLRMDSLDALNYDESVQFLANLRTKIPPHELLEDQDYWSLFDQECSDKEALIIWSKNLETGNLETDRHHQALKNHINRLHRRFSKVSDIKRFSKVSDIEWACRELNLLCEYSKFHFSEEELLLGSKLRPGHRENHETLIIDLEKLISEVRSGKYKLDKLGDYLKYWLINHIQNFDIPSFDHNN